VEIKILGGGCAKCERLERLVHEAAGELDIEATFIKVKEMDEIMAYDVMSTPALVIDEEVKSSGRIPRPEEIVEWIQAAQGGFALPKPSEYNNDVNGRSQVGSRLRR
jgi:small redox-active disulfide protein 2